MAGQTLPLRVRMKLKLQAVATVLGAAKRGFFIPYKYARAVPAPPPVYAEIEDVMATCAPAFDALLTDIGALGPELAGLCAGPLDGHWNGGYFGPLDTAAAFAIVRAASPDRIVEVGSGSSTHVLRAAAPSAEITCIDPVPRREIGDLGVSFQKGVLKEAHIDLFRGLSAGNVAFFDSSHVLFEGTDVDIIQNRILPVIPKGVIVHVHDVFLPDVYPRDWAHRGYTEQNGLTGWLLGGAFRILFASHYVDTRRTTKVDQALSDLPPHERPISSSIWLERS